MKHIIDTEQIEKLPRYSQDKFLVRYEDVRALIASSPQADDVRKDAEPSDDKLKAMRDFAMSIQLSHDYDWIDYMRDMYFIAIDKARE